MRWFIGFYQSHASSCGCYAHVCVYSIYALTTRIWSYMCIYLFVLLVVHRSSCCLVTKLLHLFVWLTACLFICMYDCCLSSHFFCITDLSLTSLFSDWLVYLFISFFLSFDESWVACASTNKIRTYTTYTYTYIQHITNCQSFPKDDTCFWPPGQLERCSYCSRQFRREVLQSHEQSCGSAAQPRTVRRAATSPMTRSRQRSTSSQGEMWGSSAGEWIFMVIAYHHVGLCCQIGFPDIYIGIECIEF